MSRSGFALPRLQQDSLEAPGVVPLPPVSQGANIASQVREALAAAGQAVSMIGQQRRIASAEEDAQNRGVAHLQAQRDIVPTGIALEEEILNLAVSGGDVSDDAISALVESRIDSKLADLTVNEAGIEQYRSEVTRSLSGVAFGARQKAVDKLLADSRVDAASDFGSAISLDDFHRTAAALLRIDPLLSPEDIKGLAIPSLQSAAKRGDRDVVMALADGIGRDSVEVKDALWTMEAVERDAREQAVAERVRSTREAYASHLADKNLKGARSAIANADIPEDERLRLSENLDGREKEIADADKNEHLTGLMNSLSRLAIAGDADGYGKAVEGAWSSGLIEEKDVPILNAKYGTMLAGELESKSQLSINALRNATTEPDRAAAIQSIQDVVTAADHALAQPPGSVGRISQDQYSEITGMADRVISEMQDIDFQQQHVIRLLAESDTASGAGFQTMTVGGEQWTDVEQAAAVADLKWQIIGATAAGRPDLSPDEQRALSLREMTDWLSKNPVAVSSEFKKSYQGFIGRAFGAVSNQDQPERLAGVRESLDDLAAIYQMNPEVARRHVPDNASELLEYMALVADLVPAGNDELLYGALNALVSQDGPVPKYNLTEDDRDMIDSRLKKAGFGDGTENIIDIRTEAYAKAQAFASMGFRGNMESIASLIGESYKSRFVKADGVAVRVDTDPLGGSLASAYGVASDAAKGVWLNSHSRLGRGDLVLDRDPIGRWRLYERGTSTPVEDSPAWSGEDLRRIEAARRNASSAIAENKGIGKSFLSRAERDTSIGMRRAPGVVGAIGGAAESAFGSVSRMVSSRIVGERHNRWKERFISDNTRDMDPWEKFVVEQLATKKAVYRGPVSTGEALRP